MWSRGKERTLSLQIYNMFPSFMDWIPGPHNRIFKNFQELRLFISEQIQWHWQSRQTGEPRDFIDCFLDQMDKVPVPATLNHTHPAKQQALEHLCPFPGTAGPGKPFPG